MQNPTYYQLMILFEYRQKPRNGQYDSSYLNETSKTPLSCKFSWLVWIKSTFPLRPHNDTATDSQKYDEISFHLILI